MEFPVTDIIFAISVVLMVAKAFGEFFERFLRLPSVMGELTSGIVIGYHAFGGMTFDIINFGPLFPSPITDFADPTNSVLFTMGQMGSIVLLFYIGLQTDINSILKSGKKSFAIAMGGVLLPFILGFSSMYVFQGLMPSVPENLFAMALFVGAVLTATSVGVTARILEDAKRLHSVEGTTILSAAVIDDIVGILVLLVVVSISSSGAFQLFHVLRVASLGVIFLFLLIYGGLKFNKHLTAIIKKFKTQGSITTIAIVAGLIGSYIAEEIGLAMIIGAFSTGLLFSKTGIVHTMRERIKPISFIFVPLFFSTVGMLIDVGSLVHGVYLALIITILAIIGKVVGCGLVSRAVGYGRKQSLIIGIGMVPRGEVALIIEAYALVIGIIPVWIFGTVAFMTIVTTFLAPILLVRLFKEEDEKEVKGK